MPTPVSRIMMRQKEPSLRAVTVIEPAMVYFTALDNRLSRIVSHIPGSTSASTERQSSVNSSPAADTVREGRRDVRGQRAESVHNKSAVARPASIREKSSNESTSRCKRPALRRATLS